MDIIPDLRRRCFRGGGVGYVGKAVVELISGVMHFRPSRIKVYSSSVCVFVCA